MLGSMLSDGVRRNEVSREPPSHSLLKFSLGCWVSMSYSDWTLVDCVSLGRKIEAVREAVMCNPSEKISG